MITLSNSIPLAIKVLFLPISWICAYFNKFLATSTELCSTIAPKKAEFLENLFNTLTYTLFLLYGDLARIGFMAAIISYIIFYGEIVLGCYTRVLV